MHQERVAIIALALARNELGKVYYTSEDATSKEATEHRCGHLGRVDHEAPPRGVSFDLAFFDHQDPVSAVRKHGPCMIAGGVIIAHDTRVGEYADRMARAEDRGLIDSAWPFATPRGLTLARIP